MKSEHIIQCEFVSWMRKTHPQVRIFAIPNGGKRGLATAARLKAEGATAGVPDLFIPALKIFIEMKTDVGSLSGKQRDWIEYLSSVGYTVIVARERDIDELKTLITKSSAAYSKTI